MLYYYLLSNKIIPLCLQKEANKLLMKKDKVTLGILTGALSIMALAACDAPTYNTHGYVLTYTNAAGEQLSYTAEDLFGTYLNDSSSVSTMYQKAYELIVRNYFYVEPGQETVLATLKSDTNAELQSIKEQCEDDASSNATTYDDEFSKILSQYGAATEDDLYETLLYNRMQTEFEDQFYENNIGHLRDSRTDDTEEGADHFEGYLQAMVPYHVSHLLVNVDASSGAHYNGTISSDDAHQLYTVAYNLALAGTSFGNLALMLSDDSASAANYGELGIMDKSTSYINEFKLGIYAYEQIYNSATSTSASESAIGVDSATQQAVKDATDSQTIGTIPYEAFLELEEMSNVTTGYNGTQVNNGDAEYYPRNILFNKYFNKHNICVITPNSVSSGTYDSSTNTITGENDYGTYNEEYAALPGFQEVPGLTIGDGSHNEILCTNEGSPILVVRGGTDGDSSYQGIHFIVINRSPFDETASVSLSDYYTTYYPGHAKYPTNDEGEPLRTYVNYFDARTSSYRERAETVYDTIVGFDSNIDKYIFEKYFESQKLVFNNKEIGEAIENWIETATLTTKLEDEEAWDETWRTYIEYLEQQTAERSKNLSEVCAIQYNLNPSERDSKLWTNGGLCDDRR